MLAHLKKVFNVSKKVFKVSKKSIQCVQKIITKTYRPPRLAIFNAVRNWVPGRRLCHCRCCQWNADYHLSTDIKALGQIMSSLNKKNQPDPFPSPFSTSIISKLIRNYNHPIPRAKPESGTRDKKGGDPDEGEAKLASA